MGNRFSGLPLAKSAGFRLINSRFGSPYHIIVEATTKCNLKCRTGQNSVFICADEIQRAMQNSFCKVI